MQNQSDDVKYRVSEVEYVDVANAGDHRDDHYVVIAEVDAAEDVPDDGVRNGWDTTHVDDFDTKSEAKAAALDWVGSDWHRNEADGDDTFRYGKRRVLTDGEVTQILADNGLEPTADTTDAELKEMATKAKGLWNDDEDTEPGMDILHYLTNLRDELQ